MCTADGNVQQVSELMDLVFIFTRTGTLVQRLAQVGARHPCVLCPLDQPCIRKGQHLLHRVGHLQRSDQRAILTHDKAGVAAHLLGFPHRDSRIGSRRAGRLAKAHADAERNTVGFIYVFSQGIVL